MQVSETGKSGPVQVTIGCYPQGCWWARRATTSRKGKGRTAPQPKMKKNATPATTSSTAPTMGVNSTISEPINPIKMTSKPKKKCDWLLVIPVTLPKTWKVEYKMLITKATTTPKRPMSIASVRIVNCIIDLLLSAIRNHKTDCRFPPCRVEGISLHAACS